MSDFERVYQIDPSREIDHPREKHPSIELSDAEYLERHLIRSGHYVKFNTGTKFDDTPFRFSKDMEEAGFTYKELPPEESMSPVLKEKYKKTRKICQDTKLKSEESPLIPMNLELPELEKVIKKGKKNATSKSETTKKKTSKNNTKTNKKSMASI